MTIFITPTDLAARLSEPNLRIVDGSWYLPMHKMNPAEEFLKTHIPGAVWFDVDGIADRSTGLPHMLLDGARFAQHAGALGLNEDQTIVVYDGLGLFSAPRVRWTLQYYGANDVLILEGGLPAWSAAGLPVESGEAHPTPAVFTPHVNEAVVRSYDQVRDALAAHSTQVLDARPAGRFAGKDPEPRPGISSGHMPGAISIPFPEFVRDGKLKPADELAELFAAKAVNTTQPIIASCGSGVTAAVIALGLETIGAKNVGLYDGAWAQWASTPGAEIVKD